MVSLIESSSDRDSNYHIPHFEILYDGDPALAPSTEKRIPTEHLRGLPFPTKS